MDCIRSVGITAFTERYRKWCKRHGYNFQPSKAKEIYDNSKNLIAVFPKDALTKTLIKQFVTQLNAVSATVEHIRSEINRIASELSEYPVVMSMYGVGASLEPQLMAETTIFFVLYLSLSFSYRHFLSPLFQKT